MVREKTPVSVSRVKLTFDLDAEVVRLIKAQVIELPTYPGVALKLQQLINTNDFGLDALVKLVEADPALSSHVLRAANSAFFRTTTPITTLPHAISRVGASELGNIAIAGTLGLQASLDGPLVALRRDSWRRSLVSAALCQALAKGRQMSAGEAFLAGLLHDFGESIAFRTFEVILGQYPDTQPQRASEWAWEGQRYHVELGMVLAAQWGLPAFITEAVTRHHEPEMADGEHLALVTLVALVDDVATRLLEAATVEAAALQGVKGLSAAEREVVERLLPRLPSLLESFEVGAPATAQAPAASLVAKATSTFSGPTEEPHLEAVVVKKDQRLTYRVQALSRSALRMTGPNPLTERNLVNVEVGALKLTATVLLCEVSDHGCVIELKPFAMSHAIQAGWEQLVRKPLARAG